MLTSLPLNSDLPRSIPWHLAAKTQLEMDIIHRSIDIFLGFAIKLHKYVERGGGEGGEREGRGGKNGARFQIHTQNLALEMRIVPREDVAHLTCFSNTASLLVCLICCVLNP